MTNTCTLCANVGLQPSISFSDKEGKAIDIEICQKCQAFIPKYENKCLSNVIEHQARIHEEQWKSSTKEELAQTLIEVSGLVKNLERYLGQPNKNNLVLEIGVGRGSLLRALRDAGYAAFGCEPATKLVECAKINYGLDSECLYEMPADKFLQDIVPVLPGHTNAILLWHVLEHLENPLQLLQDLYSILSDQGCVILQVPLLRQEMIYPEHYFLVSHETFKYVASEIGYQLEGIEYDLDNLYLTVCLRKQLQPLLQNSLPFLKCEITPSPLAQAILLRDQIIKDLRALLVERDATIAAQTKLIDDRIAGMSAMETMIRERDETIAAQTKLIDDRIAGMSAMETMIHERDETIAAQTKLIDDRIAGMSTLEKIIIESEQKRNDLTQTLTLKEMEINKLYDNKFVKILMMAKLIR